MTYLNLNGMFEDRTLSESNDRNLSGWRRHLWIYWGRWRWARKLIGGKWELWWVDPCRSAIWHPVLQWSTKKFRPGGPIAGPMEEEEWPKPPPINHWTGPYR